MRRSFFEYQIMKLENPSPAVPVDLSLNISRSIRRNVFGKMSVPCILEKWSLKKKDSEALVQKFVGFSLAIFWQMLSFVFDFRICFEDFIQTTAPVSRKFRKMIYFEMYMGSSTNQPQNFCKIKKCPYAFAIINSCEERSDSRSYFMWILKGLLNCFHITTKSCSWRFSIGLPT